MAERHGFRVQPMLWGSGCLLVASLFLLDDLGVADVHAADSGVAGAGILILLGLLSIGRAVRRQLSPAEQDPPSPG